MVECLPKADFLVPSLRPFSRISSISIYLRRRLIRRCVSVKHLLIKDIISSMIQRQINSLYLWMMIPSIDSQWILCLHDGAKLLTVTILSEFVPAGLPRRKMWINLLHQSRFLRIETFELKAY